MIKANEKYWARLVFYAYLEKLLKKNFSHFYAVNEINFPKNVSQILVTPNHFSWWDGFFIDYILRKETNYKIKLMMLEEQLKQYWFFRYVGAFSINIENKISIKNSMNYTVKLMNKKENCVVVYPQGKIEPFQKRPLDIKEGIKLILKNKLDAKIVTIGFKIDYANEQKPFVAVRIGQTFNAEDLLLNYDNYRQAFTDNLECLNNATMLNNFYKDYFQNDS